MLASSTETLASSPGSLFSQRAWSPMSRECNLKSAKINERGCDKLHVVNRTIPDSNEKLSSWKMAVQRLRSQRSSSTNASWDWPICFSEHA